MKLLYLSYHGSIEALIDHRAAFLSSIHRFPKQTRQVGLKLYVRIHHIHCPQVETIGDAYMVVSGKSSH